MKVKSCEVDPSIVGDLMCARQASMNEVSIETSTISSEINFGLWDYQGQLYPSKFIFQ